MRQPDCLLFPSWFIYNIHLFINKHDCLFSEELFTILGWHSWDLIGIVRNRSVITLKSPWGKCILNPGVAYFWHFQQLKWCPLVWFLQTGGVFFRNHSSPFNSYNANRREYLYLRIELWGWTVGALWGCYLNL